MNINSDLYNAIFKRKSFHLFRNMGKERLSSDDIKSIEEIYKTLTPLYSDIKTAIRIVPENKTTCKRGGEYCILFYSEKKGNYLQNIGYLGEQLDLYLVSQNIGTLWFGIGKPDLQQNNGLDFVIMITVAKADSSKSFRKDMYKSKRKTADEIWLGEKINGVTDIVRFAPSACNSQPWIVENEGNKLSVYRYKKPGKRGIMPANKVVFYNQIDIGIFLCFLNLCLEHNNIPFDFCLHFDGGTDSEKTLIAAYNIF